MLNSKQVPVEFSSTLKKFKKYHKVKYKNSISSLSTYQGYYELVNRQHATLSIKQAITLLKMIKPEMKKISRKCALILSVDFDTIITKKAKDIRMGRGKGAPSDKVSMIRAGSPLFSMSKLKTSQARTIFNFCKPKLSTKARFINLAQW